MKIPIWFLIILAVVAIVALSDAFQAGKKEGLRLAERNQTYTVTDNLGNTLTAKTVLVIELPSENVNAQYSTPVPSTNCFTCDNSDNGSSQEAKGD